MKKTIVSVLAVLAVLFTANQNLFAGSSRDKSASTLVVGATAVPHAELLNLIKADLAAQGIDLRVVEYTEYPLPNPALIAGDLDANYFQHLPYLESNAQWSAALTTAFGVHVEPIALYSNKAKSLAELANGATIGIPNDPSNSGRALLLLQAEGLITLNPSAGITATSRDITGNPRNLVFRELDAALLPRALGDLDAAVINGNYAIETGLNPARDSIAIEGADSPYVNYVVVKKGNENDPRIKALQAALLSQKVKDHINKTWGDGSVIAVF